MSDMKQVGGVWLPAHEAHLPKWMIDRNEKVDGKLTYQHHKLTAALAHVREFGTAIDVGAHCGLWSMHLAARFKVLHAFEPVPLHRQCFQLNVPKDKAAVSLWNCALGERDDNVAMHLNPGSSGDTWVDGAGDIPMHRLDDLLPDEKVDFIKLDCEGYELFALRGAEALLTRCRPVVIVEQKPGRAEKYGLPQTQAVDYLKGLGAKLRNVMSGDYILSWD